MIMMPYTTSARIGIVTTKTSAARTLIVNAMIIEPNTMNGLRKRRRSPMLRPVCAWLISLVRRVISVLVPIRSSCVKDSDSMWSNVACRRFAPKPALAFAANHCAVKLLRSPASARSTRITTREMIYVLLFPAMPTSMICATTSGTSRSKKASRSLKSGARTLSFLYSLR